MRIVLKAGIVLLLTGGKSQNKIDGYYLEFVKTLIAAFAVIATPAASIAQYSYSPPSYSRSWYSAPSYDPVRSYSNMVNQGQQQLNYSRQQRQIDANAN